MLSPCHPCRSPEALVVFAHQVSPSSQQRKDPNLLAVTRQGCDSDITCYLENQTETECGDRGTDGERGTYGPAARGCTFAAEHRAAVCSPQTTERSIKWRTAEYLKELV